MKIFLIIVLFFFMALSEAQAQNVQLLYDMGKERKYLTSTVETFKTDKWGSSFYFIDFNYGYGDVKGASLAYFEIARGLKFWKSPFELHIEYNGGFGQLKYKGADGNFHAYQIRDAWLFGGNYTWNTADYSKVFTLQAMYKNIREKNDLSFQITGVWSIKLFKNKVSLDGYADYWREDNVAFVTNKKTNFVFQAQPQFWYNLTDQFSIGSEIGITSNFAGHDGMMVNPSIAGKWKL